MEILKLGGSVVSDKSRDCAADLPAIRAIGEALTRHAARRILIHGTGSFGKPYAIRYQYLGGHFEANRLERYLEIRNSLKDLGRIVARELAAAGAPVAELDAYHCFARESQTGALSFAEPEHFALLLERGAIPLVHGDLYVCPRQGYRVVSSDQMVVELTRRYRPERVLFLSDVPGVLHPKTREPLPTITRDLARELDGATGSDALDVSGGMSAKVRWALEAAALCGECWILNGRDQEALEAALSGRPFLGTRALAEASVS
jgi:isopentenyl phosphate kinase